MKVRLFGITLNYALRALAILNRTDGFITVEQIAKEADIPYSYAGKVCQALRAEGLAHARRGRNTGGYRIDRIALERTMLFMLFGNPRCPLGADECGLGDQCPFRRWCDAFALAFTGISAAALLAGKPIDETRKPRKLGGAQRGNSVSQGCGGKGDRFSSTATDLAPKRK